MSILVAGNYCHDLLLGNDGEHRALGGSSAYAASVLQAMGEPFEVVAKVGRDFLYSHEVLRAPRIEGPHTTSFVDDYRSGARRQRATAVGAAIRPDDLAGPHPVGLACGIAGELPLAALARMRALCGTLVADAQSLLREVTEAGEVRLRALPEEAAALLDVLKADEEEARLLEVPALRRRMTLLLTHGARGSTVLTAHQELHLPAFDAAEVDPTGAGDCFLAGFAAALARGMPLEEAGRVGAWHGARAVEQRGVPRRPKPGGAS